MASGKEKIFPALTMCLRLPPVFRSYPRQQPPPPPLSYSQFTTQKVSFFDLQVDSWEVVFCSAADVEIVAVSA